jgi:hypothetical protein
MEQKAVNAKQVILAIQENPQQWEAFLTDNPNITKVLASAMSSLSEYPKESLQEAVQVLPEVPASAQPALDWVGTSSEEARVQYDRNISRNLKPLTLPDDIREWLFTRLLKKSDGSDGGLGITYTKLVQLMNQRLKEDYGLPPVWSQTRLSKLQGPGKPQLRLSHFVLICDALGQNPLTIFEDGCRTTTSLERQDESSDEYKYRNVARAAIKLLYLMNEDRKREFRAGNESR